VDSFRVTDHTASEHRFGFEGFASTGLHTANGQDYDDAQTRTWELWASYAPSVQKLPGPTHSASFVHIAD
jgi:hypothetical protein